MGIGLDKLTGEQTGKEQWGTEINLLGKILMELEKYISAQRNKLQGFKDTNNFHDIYKMIIKGHIITDPEQNYNKRKIPIHKPFITNTFFILV